MRNPPSGSRSSRDHHKGSAFDSKLRGGVADKFSIGIDFQRRFCFQPDAFRFRILDLGHSQVIPEIDGWEHTEQPPWTHRQDLADVELSIAWVGIRRNPHTIAIKLCVGEGSE